MAAGNYQFLWKSAPFTLLCLIVSLNTLCHCKDGENEEPVNEKWKKKDVRDYNDADLERLFEQWEDADDPLEDDELPEWKKPQPKIDLSKLDPNDPEAMLKQSKHGKTLMMFATVSGNPTEPETEDITQLWQGSLFNAHYELQRYVVGSNRVLFMLKDGSKAWEIKNFLVSQERCELVTIEGQDFPGKGSKGAENSQEKEKNKSNQKGTKKKSASKKRKDSENETKKVKIPKPVKEKIEL